MDKTMSFKSYITVLDDIKTSKTRKKMNKKSPKNRFYGSLEGGTTNSPISGAPAGDGGSGGSGGDGGGMGESSIYVRSMWNSKAHNVVDEEEEAAAAETEQSPEMGMEMDDMEGESDAELFADPEEEGMDDEEPEDPNRQGIIRTVVGAHLVYKRKNEEGSFEELWLYKVDSDMRKTIEIRHEILSGTDIPKSKTKSPDRTQSYSLWTSGNVQFLEIAGLVQ